jgi:hypothetical protein
VHEPIRKEIDGLTFVIGKIPGRKSLLVLHRLARTVFPALALVVKDSLSVESKDLSVDTLMMSLGDALPRLFQDLTEDQFNALINDLLQTVQVIDGNGNAIAPVLPQFDLIFTGKPFTVIKLLTASVMENYGGFLQSQEFANAMAAVKAKASASSTSPKKSDSAGPSGASSSSTVTP